jgi:hypothetical protein
VTRPQITPTPADASSSIIAALEKYITFTCSAIS